MASSKKNQDENEVIYDWSQLLGFDQHFIKLQKLLTNNLLPPVILFYGKRGIGKSLWLQEVAALHFCLNKNACGSCLQCQKVRRQEHDDIITIKGADTYKIEHANQIQEHLHLQARQSEKSPYASRIVVINDVEQANTQAGNRLLKIMEEPPPRSRFILSSSCKYKIMATIRSRCFFWPVSPPSIKQSLAIINSQANKIQVSPPSVENIRLELHYNGGAPGKIVNKLSQGGGTQDWEELRNVLETKNGHTLITAIENYHKSKRLNLSEIIRLSEVLLNQTYLKSHRTEFSNREFYIRRRRRELLSKLHRLVEQQGLTVNLRMALERLAYNWPVKQ